MGCKIIFSPQAIEDLESAVRFIAKDNPGAAVRVGNALIDRLATGEKFIPIAAKHGAQTSQCWQAGKVVASFDVLNVAGAHAAFLGQSFLRQVPTRSQGGDVLTESLAMRAGFGFARRHGRILSKACSVGNEVGGTLALIPAFSPRRRRIVRRALTMRTRSIAEHLFRE